MQHMFQQSLVLLQFINRVVDIPAACRFWSAQCTLCSRPWTFTGTVFGWLWTRLLLCSDRCSGWSCRKLWSLRSCSGFVRRPVLGQGRCARWCNDWGVRNAWFDCGYMLRFTRVSYGRFCTIFFMKEWTRIMRSILVASLPVHLPMMKWPRSSSTTSVVCFLDGFAGISAPRAVFTTLPA